MFQYIVKVTVMYDMPAGTQPMTGFMSYMH